MDEEILGREPSARRATNERPYVPKARKVYHPDPRFSVCKYWKEHATPHLRFGRVIRYLFDQAQGERHEWAQPLSDEPSTGFIPWEEAIVAPFALWSSQASLAEQLGWKVQVHVLKKIKQIYDRHQAQLIVFDLGYPHAFSRAIESLTGQVQGTYVPAGEQALSEAKQGKRIYLENDGHWTGLGADLVAKALAKEIRRPTKKTSR